MGECWEILQTVLFYFCLFWISAASDTCYKVDSCQCVFSDGRYIDLTPLASLTSSPRWKDNYDEFYNNRFSYNPCYSFSEGTCQDVAVCEVNNAGQYFSCGTQDSGQFLTDASSGLPALEYSSVDRTGLTRYSRVILNCINTSGDTLEIEGETKTGHYGFKLNSRYCCPKQGPTTSPPDGGDHTYVGTYLVIGFGVVFVSTILIGLICYWCGGPSQTGGRNRIGVNYIRGQSSYMAMETPPPYDHA